MFHEVGNFARFRLIALGFTRDAVLLALEITDWNFDDAVRVLKEQQDCSAIDLADTNGVISRMYACELPICRILKLWWSKIRRPRGLSISGMTRTGANRIPSPCRSASTSTNSSLPRRSESSSSEGMTTNIGTIPQNEVRVNESRMYFLRFLT